MLAALALTTVLQLAPAQAGDIEIKNVRLTHGVLGAARKDEKILPGDIAVVSFDIHGLKPRSDGKISYSAGFELKEKGGKSLMTQDLEPKEAINSLGGDAVPSVTFVNFGLDTKPGTYVISVTIKDSTGKQKAVLNKEVDVEKQDFGFVRVRFMAPTDPSAPLPAPPVAVPGQAIHLRYALAGFKPDKNKLSDLSVEMSVLDADGRKTVDDARAKVQAAFKEGEPFMDFLPIPLQLNRPGKYKVVLKAKDNASGKSAEQALDLTVLKN